LDASPTGKVYVYYSACTVTDERDEIIYSFSGTYRNAICVQNCTTVDIWIDTTGTPATSSYISAVSDCTPIVYSCDTCYDITVINNEYTFYDGFIEFEDTNYGNVNVTITMTGGSDINQFFLGTVNTGLGAIFNFDSTGGTQTQYFGFWNAMNQQIDLGIYSTNTGTTEFQPFTFNICVDCPTLLECTGNTTTDCYECFDYTFTSLDTQTIYWYECDGTARTSGLTEGQVINIECARECSVVGNGSLSVSTSCGFTGTDCATNDTTINVTSAGWIKYYDYFGVLKYINIPSTGSYTLSGCVVCNTISGGTPYTPVATFDTPVCTDLCSPLNGFTNHNISIVPQNTSTNSCLLTSPNTIYTNYAVTTMAVGVTIYSNKQLTVTFNGANKWFRIVWNGSVGNGDAYGVRIDGNGVIQEIASCDVSPTPTPTPTLTATNPVLPVSGLNWSTTVNNPCSSTPWVISNSNQTIRYNIVDSLNCGGTCGSTQAGTATANITVGASDVWLGVDFEGVGELEESNYELLSLSLDSVQVADAHAAGGGLGCAVGPVVKTYSVSPPYYLPAYSNHTLFLNFTTNDPYYHLNSYYEINLSLSTTPSFTGSTTSPYVLSGDACSAATSITTIGDGPSMCTSNVLYNSTFGDQATGEYYISDGTDVIKIKITNGNDNAVVVGTCLTCPV
jgi:hypothetical protein